MLTTGCQQAPVSSVYLSSPYGLPALCVSAAGVEMPLAPNREFCDSWIVCFGWFVERGVKRDLQMMSPSWWNLWSKNPDQEPSV